MQLKHKNVLITGANRGIGLAFTKVCAREKANLFLVTRQMDMSLEKEFLQLGANSVRWLCADLNQDSQVKELLTNLQSLQMDLLFNNAGVLTGGLLERQTDDEVRAIVKINLLVLVQLTQAVLPGMIQRREGKIINHSSVSAIMHFPCATTYAATKAAVWALTDCLNLELKGTGVTTLCLITPGIKTRMFDEINLKYGEHMKTPQGSISPNLYAEKIYQAVLEDKEVLWPEGWTYMGLKLAQVFPRVFSWILKQNFHRNY